MIKYFRDIPVELGSRVALFLVFCFFLLQPVGKSLEIPYAILGLCGIVQLVKSPRSLLETQQSKIFALLFLFFFIPVVLSCFDAVNLEKSAVIALVSLRMIFSGWFVIHFFRDEEMFGKLDVAVGLVILIWLFDGVYQAITGHDLFGGIPPLNRLGSVFVNHPLKFGIMAAVFSPFLLVSADRRGAAWLFPALVLSGGVVFFSGSRGGWISFAAVVAGLFLYHLFVTRTMSWRFVATVMVSMIVFSLAAYQWNPSLRSKVDQTLLVFQGDEHSINQAITFRVPIWRTAVRMFMDNPINGVGARGFRYAYEDSALTRDLHVEPGATKIGAFHAHQLLLDVAAETGTLGLLGLIGMWIVLIRLWLRSSLKIKNRMLPYGLSLLAIFFPLNTHFSTYSSSWAATIFIFIALFCAASRPGVSLEPD